jgi:hypothetical protein
VTAAIAIVSIVPIAAAAVAVVRQRWSDQCQENCQDSEYSLHEENPPSG